MFESLIYDIQRRIDRVRADIRQEELGIIQEQDLTSESPVLMNESDFIEPQGSNETPVDMFNIKDEENLKRRDGILKERERNEKMINMILYGKGA